MIARDDRVAEILQKIKSPYPSPVKFFSSLFFQVIDKRLHEIRQRRKSSTTTSIDRTHVKWKTRSTPFSMNLSEFGVAGQNPELHPFTGWPPVKLNVWVLPTISCEAASLTNNNLQVFQCCEFGENEIWQGGYPVISKITAQKHTPTERYSQQALF